MIAAALLIVALVAATDGGAVDPLGPRKGGRARLAPSPDVRIDSSLAASPALDAGYDGMTAPSAIALPTYGVHIFASEELGPDALRRLLRPDVTLWLDTRTNMLRASTLDALRAGGRSFVRLRAPINDAHQQQFATLPSGVWLDAKDGGQLKLHWIGARAVAFEVEGPAGGREWGAMAAFRPQVIFWAKPGCEADSWAAARSMKGIVITVDATGLCAYAGPPVKPSFRGMAPSTERAPFVWLRPESRPEQVRELLVKEPGTQILISVGDRASSVKAVSALLDALEGRPRK